MFEGIEFKTIVNIKGRSCGNAMVRLSSRTGSMTGSLSKKASAMLEIILPGFGGLEILASGNRIFALKPIMKERRCKYKIFGAFGATAIRDNTEAKPGSYKLVEYKGMLVCDLDNQ